MPVGDSGYRVAVQGPNQFWHEAAGSPTGAAAGVDARVGRGSTRHRLNLVLSNAGQRSITLQIRALRYGDHSETVRLRAHQTRTLAWPADQGWYDIEVLASGDPAFRRRLTGRIEDGHRAVSA